MRGSSGAALHSMRADRSVMDTRVERRTLRRIVAFARPHRRLITIFLAVTVIDSALVAVPPLLLQRLIDDGVGGEDLSLVLQLAGIVALVAVMGAGLNVINGWFSSRIGEGLIFDLRTTVFAHVQRQSLAFFTRTQTGALVSRLNNDVIGAQRAFTSTLQGTVSNVVSAVVVGATMMFLSWQVTLLCLSLFPFLLIASRLVGTRLAGLTRAQMDGNADLGNAMTERFNVGGAMLLKLFGKRETEDRLYAEKAAVVRDLGVQISLLSRIFMSVMGLVPALATALVYGLGGAMAIQGDLSVGTIVALGVLLTRLLGPLQALSNVRIDVMTALVSFDRVFEVLDLPSMIQEKPGAPSVNPRDARVEFRDVHFAYPRPDQVSLASLESLVHADSRDGGPVLHGVSFVAEPGQMIALVGPSGAGKSTVSHLVARLYDATQGQVLVGGLDVRDVDLQSLEDMVGYVTQDAHMFHDSIRENLRYAKPGASDDDMWAALESAHVAPLIRQLPDGLGTVVGDRGYRLSGGERQRLAIARLLLKAPSIVVLDEATAHLDSESEAAVQRALDGALRGRTSLVIAHRLSTVRRADMIAVMDCGRVVERGTHADLLDTGGLYADLYRTQFFGDDSGAAPTGDAPSQPPKSGPLF